MNVDFRCDLSGAAMPLTHFWEHTVGSGHAPLALRADWNEPNLKHFWTGNQKDYFKLYRYRVEAIKAVDERLKVGGPATAKNEWITDFVEFCDKNNLPADFVSTHHYTTDAFGETGDETIEQLAASRRSIMRENAQDVFRQARGKPVFYTEWNTSSNPRNELHDESYAAAFVTKTIMEANGLVEGYSLWTFTDIFEENYFPSEPFHGGCIFAVCTGNRSCYN
jgi:xylan 1,4-beta-xylosidase